MASGRRASRIASEMIRAALLATMSVAVVQAFSAVAAESAVTGSRCPIQIETPSRVKTWDEVSLRVTSEIGKVEPWLLRVPQERVIYRDGSTPPQLRISRRHLKRYAFRRSQGDLSLFVSPEYRVRSGDTETWPAGRYRVVVFASVSPAPWKDGDVCVITSEPFDVEMDQLREVLRH